MAILKPPSAALADEKAPVPDPELLPFSGFESEAVTISADEVTQPDPERKLVDPVPDGGLQAWLQVLGSFVILVDTWGIINSFGAYQTYYEAHLTDRSSSDISWIGSLQGSLIMLSGIVSGPLFDQGYFRHLLVAGITLVVVGMFMTSLCTEYWQIVLAQGVCVGIGSGALFLPGAAILVQYFDKKRALVLGISSVGSPLAGMLFPILFSHTEGRIGFGWATRIIAFVLLGVSAIPLATMRTRIPPSGHARALVDKSAFKDAPFMAFSAANFFCFMGLYVPFFYIQLYAFSKGILTKDAPGGFDSNYLVTLLNAGSIAGRLLPNYAADHCGGLNVMTATTLASALLALAWLGIDNLGGLCAFAVLYGMWSGGIVSLTPSVVAGLSPEMGLIGTRMGMLCFAAGTSILVGTPVAGAIVRGYGDAEWTKTIVYCGICLTVGALACILARGLSWRRKGGWKA